MQEKRLFEYAVIRIVPRVEREEFVNTGIIVYMRDLLFLKCRYTVDEERLRNCCSSIAVEEVREQLRAFEEICLGTAAGGPIGKLDVASRFRWLTATRSTVIQTSRVHPGLSADADETLSKLYQQLVL